MYFQTTFNSNTSYSVSNLDNDIKEIEKQMEVRKQETKNFEDTVNKAQSFFNKSQPLQIKRV